MNIWNFIACLGIIFTSAQMLPQIIKAISTKKVDDLSSWLCIIVSSSSLSWLIYGIHLQDIPIVIANSINAAGALYLLYLKIRKN